MNKDSLQEKFQITAPPKPDEDGADANWVFPFRNSPAQHSGEAGYMHRNNNKSSASMEPMGVKFNQLPPGMEIDNQLRKRFHSQPFVTAGESDVSADTNSKSMLEGFTRKEMKSTDDQYQGEHMDHFYGIAYGTDHDGVQYEGFVERNNYLDRE